MEYGTPGPLEDSEDSDPFLTPFLPSFFGLVWSVWSGWWWSGLVDWWTGGLAEGEQPTNAHHLTDQSRFV